MSMKSEQLLVHKEWNAKVRQNNRRALLKTIIVQNGATLCETSQQWGGGVTLLAENLLFPLKDHTSL